MTQTLLNVKDLAVEFVGHKSTVHAVNGVNLRVRAGEIVGIVGESGCGKSTAVKGILGLLQAPGRVTGGSAELAGHGDLLAMKQKNLRQVRGAAVGYVAQNPFGSLNPIYSIEQQFRNILRAHGQPSGKKEARERARAMLASVGIAGPERVLDGHAHQLSGGMAQRVVIAMAMLLEPELIIADEPTTGLDVTVQRQILDLIRERVVDSTRGILLVTHDLGVIAQYCHRVVVMYAGKVVEAGSVDTVFGEPAHPYTSALLGAIPRAGHKLTRLRGSVPDLRTVPLDCSFRQRCSHAFDACSVSPDLREIAPDHLVACHLSERVGHAAS
jgi:oligopeptide/dipeptide ABC transporter ATP-binding protein